jgi:hypothetical protein
MPMRTFVPSLDSTLTLILSPIMMLCLAFRVRTSTGLGFPARSSSLGLGVRAERIGRTIGTQIRSAVSSSSTSLALE